VLLSPAWSPVWASDRLGWAGPAQPMWVELGPAQKKKYIYIYIKNKKKIESVEIKFFACLRKKCIFINLFNDIRIMNKKRKIY